MDRNRCIRCGRPIDALAGTCPFCNWTQTTPPPSGAAAPPPAVLYTPPEEMDVRKLMGIAGGILLTLILAFLAGLVINRDGAPKHAPEDLEAQAAEHNAENLKPKRADTPLIPAGQGGIENEPITSAPTALDPGQVPDDYQRRDLTAVSADEYARMARSAQAQQNRTTPLLTDPRSLTGPAYAPAPRTLNWGQTPIQRNAPRVVRTRPVPQYQPIPPMNAGGKARFTLIIGTDGRVKDVDVERTLRHGDNAALLAAIQSWRFKPATENGEPVAAPYSVEISFQRE